MAINVNTDMREIMKSVNLENPCKSDLFEIYDATS